MMTSPPKTTFTLNVENRSQYADDEVFLNITGLNEEKSAWYYLARPGDAALTEYDNTPATLLGKKHVGSFVGNDKYFIPLGDLNPVPNAPHTYTMEVPRENLVSGRMTVSFGQRLPGIGINAPGYAYAVDDPDATGTPVTAAATATGTAAGDGITGLTLDATRQIYPGEPVTGAGVPDGTVVKVVTSASSITLSQSLTNGPVSLTFTPPAFNIPLALQGPSFTGEPDYQVPFEFIEFSATSDPGQSDPWYTLFINTSVVDFFSIGLSMEVGFGDGSTRTVGFPDGERAKVLAEFNSLSGNPVGFMGFVLAGPAAISYGGAVDATRILRVLGPQIIIQLRPDESFANYLQPVIDAAWTQYQATALNVPDTLKPPYGFAYAGDPITNSLLHLTCTTAVGGQGGGLGEAYALPAPTTAIVFKCDDSNSPPDSYSNSGTDAHKRMASLLCSALNRGVFDDYSSWSNDKDGEPTFYQRQDSLYNVYARILHSHAIDNKVYGFGYDDVYGQDPTISGPIGKTARGEDPPGSPITQVTVTIPAFDRFPSG